jgi:K+-sensing histidine kinase KdpD
MWVFLGRQQIEQIAISLGLTAATTTILLGFDFALEPQHLIFGYLVPVVFIAIRYGSAVGMTCLVASNVFAAYFLYPPRFSLYIRDPLHVAELSFFFLVAVAASQFIGGLADDERVEKRGAKSRR